MFAWIDFNQSLKRAHTSLAVFVVVLLGGTALVGFDASDPERQAVGVVAFVAAYTCLLWLFRQDRRERRARQKAEQAQRTTHQED